MTYITFRSGAAFMLSLIIALVIGRKIIDRLQLMQVGETIRDLGLEGQLKKEGTPTMGGIIIILSLLVPCLLVGNLTNIYMVLMLIATVWCGTIGFLDDYLKIKKHNKDGMKGKFKIVGQVGLGLLVGLTMCLSPDITQCGTDRGARRRLGVCRGFGIFPVARLEIYPDHHPLCQRQQLRLRLAHVMDGEICPDGRMDRVCYRGDSGRDGHQ